MLTERLGLYRIKYTSIFRYRWHRRRFEAVQKGKIAQQFITIKKGRRRQWQSLSSQQSPERKWRIFSSKIIDVYPPYKKVTKENVETKETAPFVGKEYAL